MLPAGKMILVSSSFRALDPAQLSNIQHLKHQTPRTAAFGTSKFCQVAQNSDSRPLPMHSHANASRQTAADACATQDIVEFTKKVLCARYSDTSLSSQRRYQRPIATQIGAWNFSTDTATYAGAIHQLC